MLWAEAVGEAHSRLVVVPQSIQCMRTRAVHAMLRYRRPGTWHWVLEGLALPQLNHS